MLSLTLSVASDGAVSGGCFIWVVSRSINQHSCRPQDAGPTQPPYLLSGSRKLHQVAKHMVQQAQKGLHDSSGNYSMLVACAIAPFSSAASPAAVVHSFPSRTLTSLLNLAAAAGTATICDCRCAP